jgi:LmbE family N-acetylglucosaminyl deacetylase
VKIIASSTNSGRKSTASESASFVVLSPHLDDVVLSIGGYLAAQCHRSVLVLNIFSRSSFLNNRKSTLEGGTAIRKQEDKMALGQLKHVRRHNLDFLDAVDRGISFENVFSHSAEIVAADPLVMRVREALDLHIPQNAYVLAPAAFGNHYDHVLVRQAANHRDCAYYADLPYACRTNYRNEEALRFLENRQLSVQFAEPSTIEQHLTLSQLYKTQVLPRHLDEIRTYLVSSGYRSWT